MGKGGVRLLCPQFLRVSICISFISLNITILEPETGYLSRDKNGNFFAAPHCVRYQRNFSPPSMSSTHTSVEALDFSGISRRKGCSGNKFTADYKPINRGVPQWTVLDPIRCFPIIMLFRPICWFNFQMIKLLAFLL